MAEKDELLKALRSDTPASMPSPALGFVSGFVPSYTGMLETQRKEKVEKEEKAADRLQKMLMEREKHQVIINQQTADLMESFTKAVKISPGTYPKDVIERILKAGGMGAKGVALPPVGKTQRMSFVTPNIIPELNKYGFAVYQTKEGKWEIPTQDLSSFWKAKLQRPYEKPEKETPAQKAARAGIAIILKEKDIAPTDWDDQTKNLYNMYAEIIGMPSFDVIQTDPGIIPTLWKQLWGSEKTIVPKVSKEAPVPQKAKTDREKYIEGAIGKGYSQVEAESLANQQGLK